MRITAATILMTSLLAFACGSDAQLKFKTAVAHSAEANSPYAVLEGRTIKLKPDEFTFQIPEEWLNQDQEKKLHLSWGELDGMFKIRPHGIDFDGEDAAVMNEVISFDRCAAHFGSKGWNNGIWNDLQGRAYIVDLSPDAFAESVKVRGLDKAKKLFESAEYVSVHYRGWQQHSLKVVDAPTHFILHKKIDFYYRQFGDKTIVFVFVAPWGFEDTISDILASVKPPPFSSPTATKPK